MGLSYSTASYVEPSTGTSSVQVVPEGTRGRLMSVWFHPKAAYATPWTFTLRDGDSSGDVIFESDVIFTLTGLGVRGNGPFSFVRNGILFNNGLNAKGAAPGIKSVTVTYIGGG